MPRRAAPAVNARTSRPGTVHAVIGYLKGRALSENLVDVSGVGYLVHTAVPLTAGDEVELLVTTVVRDDAIVLYGFSSTGEQALFNAVIKVSGVGPASALALLGTLGVEGLVNAIAAKDEAVLSSVKGIGKKSATALAATCVLPDGVAVSGDSRVRDISSALTGLGFDRARAQEAARRAISESGSATDEELLSAALVFAHDLAPAR